MPTITLKEKELPGDFFAPPSPQQGDPWPVIERVLEDDNGNPVGSFNIRGTFMKVDPPDDPLIAINETYRITGIANRQGTICTQGVLRYSDLANPATIAIIGGTDHFKNARGTLTFIYATHTLVFDYSS